MMKRELMMYIASNAGIYSKFIGSTGKIAKDLRISQQSVSRLIIELEKQKMLKKETSPKGVKISIDSRGKDYLLEEYKRLKKIFCPKREMSGKLFKGIGEGEYYIKEYSQKIKEVLGYKPYPGTLNLRVKENDVKSFLSDIKPVIIKGFRTKQRSFGDIIAYRILLGGLEAAIVIPERTLHREGVVEIVGQPCFRTALNLKDSDNVKVYKMPKSDEDE